jgi:hypothetical protein
MSNFMYCPAVWLCNKTHLNQLERWIAEPCDLCMMISMLLMMNFFLEGITDESKSL